MKKPQTEIERLDSLAEVELVQPTLMSASVRIAFLCPVLLLILIGAGGNWWMWTLFAMVVATLIMIRRRWCHAMYAISLLHFFAAAGILVSWGSGSEQSFLESTSDQMVLLLALTGGVAWWHAAPRTIAVQAEEYDKERGQVALWLSDLRHGERPGVIEFSEKSFWSGHWTYRLLNPGHCWAVAKFKLGNPRALEEYRVLELSAVRVIQELGQRIRIRIAGRTIWNVIISPEMLRRLLAASNGVSVIEPASEAITSTRRA